MSASDGAALESLPLFDLMMGAFDIDPDRPLQDSMKRKEVYDELTKLRRITADLSKKRLSSAAKLYVEERKRELELAKAAVDLQKDLARLQVQSETNLAVAAIQAAQRAGQYVAKQENRLYRPDITRVNQAVQGARSASEIIQQLTGDPIMETTSGLSAPSDEVVYARLLRFAKDTNGSYFTIEGDQVKPGDLLQNADSATFNALKRTVESTYGAFERVEKTIDQSRQVQREAGEIVDNARTSFSEGLAQNLEQQLKLAAPGIKKAQEEVARGVELLEESDEELKGAERERERLEAELSRMPKDKVKAALAKAVANPRFRQWAESNGFRIGSADELGSEDSYREGRDDVRAVMLFGIQDSTGMRVAKRKGRLVSVPSREEFVETFTAPQKQMRAYANKALASGGSLVLLEEGDGSVSYIDVAGERRLRPDGTIARITKDEVSKLFDEGRVKTLDADDEGAFDDAKKAFRSAVGNIRPDRQASGSGMYREIRLTAGDIRRGVRVLQDIESGDIIEVPLDTEMEVIEDVRVPLTQRIGKRADERFFERERKRFQDDLLGEEELPRPQERPEDFEGEEPERVAGLPDVTEDLELALAGDDPGLPKERRETLRRRALDRTRAQSARETGAAEVGPGLPLSDADKLQMLVEQRRAAGMSRARALRLAREALAEEGRAPSKRPAPEPQKAPDMRQQAEARLGEAAGQPEKQTQFAGIADAAAAARQAARERNPTVGDRRLEFMDAGNRVSYDPDADLFTYTYSEKDPENPGKTFIVGPDKKQAHDALLKAFRRAAGRPSPARISTADAQAKRYVPPGFVPPPQGPAAPEPSRFDQFLERMRALRGARQERKAERKDVREDRKRLRAERQAAMLPASPEALKAGSAALAQSFDKGFKPPAAPAVLKPFPSGLGGRTYTAGEGLEFEYDPDSDVFSYRVGDQKAEVGPDNEQVHSAFKEAMLSQQSQQFRPLKPGEISDKRRDKLVSELQVEE